MDHSFLFAFVLFQRGYKVTLKVLASRRPCSEFSKVSGFTAGITLGLTYILDCAGAFFTAVPC